MKMCLVPLSFSFIFYLFIFLIVGVVQISSAVQVCMWDCDRVSACLLIQKSEGSFPYAGRVGELREVSTLI